MAKRRTSLCRPAPRRNAATRHRLVLVYTVLVWSGCTDRQDPVAATPMSVTPAEPMLAAKRIEPTPRAGISTCEQAPEQAQEAPPAESTMDGNTAERPALVASFVPRLETGDNGIIAATTWSRATAVQAQFSGRPAVLRALHDGRQLFIRLRYPEPDPDPKQPRLAFYFEDDGAAPDRVLDGKHDDCHYIGVSGLSGGGYRDAHWEDGWSVAYEFGGLGAASGGITGSWRDGEWTVQMWTALATGEPWDIAVTDTATLGFAIVDWRGGMARRDRAWPLGADPYKPQTWGDLQIDLSDVHEQTKARRKAAFEQRNAGVKQRFVERQRMRREFLARTADKHPLPVASHVID